MFNRRNFLKSSVLGSAGIIISTVIIPRTSAAQTHSYEIIPDSKNKILKGFLQRSGKLFSKDDKLYLQVEQSAIDILLDHLPWNLSVIKLPWMPDILRVEWR